MSNLLDAAVKAGSYYIRSTGIPVLFTSGGIPYLVDLGIKAGAYYLRSATGGGDQAQLDTTGAKTNDQDPNGFAWTVLNQNDVYLLGLNPIQGNYPFQHQDRMPFSPFTSQLATIDNALIALLLLKGMKSENLKELMSLAKDYMRNVAKVIESVADMGNANWANHTSSTILMASVLHRLGMLDDQGLVKVQDHCRSVFDKMWEKDTALGALGGVTTLVTGSKTEGAGGAAGLGAIAKILGGAAP